MSDAPQQKNGRLTAAHGIQLGAIVAAISVIAYILQPVQSDIKRIEAALGEHSLMPNHAGTAAELASIKTDLAAIRVEIAGSNKLTTTEIGAISERLDYLRGALASAMESDTRMVERIARVEEALRLSGMGQALGPVPNDDVHCYSKCHNGKGMRR